MKVFGPIPSRRLGRSLGINNIPPKSCSYSCVYCQVGRTSRMMKERQKFYEPTEILFEVNEKVKAAQKLKEPIDFLTIVPDGEPTLDVNLGNTIEQLKTFDIKIAVITNGSLLWRKDVREELCNADLVSVKIDSVVEEVWRKINQPHRKLSLRKIIEGIERFSQHFKGDLLTETMLVEDINDFDESLIETAVLINWLSPTKAYLLIPTRPPAESWIMPPSNEVINKAFQIFRNKVKNVELLTRYEGNDFSFSSDAEKELLSILSVHPMRKDAIDTYLKKAGFNWDLIESLINKNLLEEVQYAGSKFLVKNIKSYTST